jgi:hypothetical protein
MGMVQLANHKRLSTQFLNLSWSETPFQELDRSFDTWEMHMFSFIDFSKPTFSQEAYQTIISKLCPLSESHRFKSFST